MKKYKENFFIWILKKLKIIQIIPVEKRSACSHARSICNQDCIQCVWYQENE